MGHHLPPALETHAACAETPQDPYAFRGTEEQGCNVILEFPPRSVTLPYPSWANFFKSSAQCA
jgi:hypothetical protein